MLLSKLRRLNPTKILTHPFSKSRLGFCHSSSIIQQKQTQDDEETNKQITPILNDPTWNFSGPDSFVKSLNPNSVQTIIGKNLKSEPRLLWYFFRDSYYQQPQNIKSYLLFSKRCVESCKLTGDPDDLVLARHALCHMLRHVAKTKTLISDVLDAMTSIGVCSSLFTLVIYAHMNLRLLDEGVYILLNYKNGDCFPDSICLNLFMRELLRHRTMDLFWEVYERMIEANVTFNHYLYANLINGYVKSRKTEELINLKNEIVATGIKVDLETYICIITGLCKLGKYEEAIKILGGMKDDGVLVKANCYYPIIRGLCKAKRIEEVRGVIAEMEENGVRQNRLTFGALRTAFASKNNIMIYFKESIAHGKIPDEGILATLFEGAYGRRNTRKLLSIMINVIDDSVFRDNINTYNVFIQRLIEYHKIDLAMELLSEIHKRGLIPDRDTYNVLIQRLLWCDKMDLAMELFSEIHKRGLIPHCDTYRYLIDNGDEEKARLLLNEMQQRGIGPKDVTFSEMVEAELPR